MRKLILSLIATCIMMISTSIAVDTYPQYIYNNPNIPIVHGHMGGALYLDTTSTTVKYISKTTILFAENTISAEYDREYNLKSMQEPHTRWYYYTSDVTKRGTTVIIIDGQNIDVPPYVNNDVAYVSYDNGNSWKPFYISNTTGYNLSARQPFIKGLESLRAKGQLNYN